MTKTSHPQSYYRNDGDEAHPDLTEMVPVDRHSFVSLTALRALALAPLRADQNAH